MQGGEEPGVSREAAKCSIIAALGGQLVTGPTFTANSGNIYQVFLEK